MATKELPFRTAYSGAVRHTTPSGKPTIELWGYEVKKNGSKELVVTGEENIYEKIQADLESTKIENILKRASVGDYSDFRPDGIYMDTTDIPKNMVEAQAAMMKLENEWKKLPADIKAKFDNDIGKFAAEAGSDSWISKLGLVKEAPLEEKVVPVPEDKGEAKDE